MDPVTHILFGQTVAVTVRRQLPVKGITAALLLGSVLPDSDAVIAPRGFDLYLQAHASGTHSLLGAIIGGVILTLVLRLALRDSRTFPLLLASWLGTLGHIFWDLADGSDIRLFKPFSDVMFGWHLVAMSDPLVLLVLAAAVFVAWRRPMDAFKVGTAALVLLSLLLVVKKTTQDWARARYTASVAAAPPEAVAIAPVWGRLSSWTIYDRVGEDVRGWSVDGRSGGVALLFEYRDEAQVLAARISRTLPVVRRFLGFSKIPFARLEQRGGRRLVLWSDVTSCSPGRCDVSFGGAYDSKIAPLYQVIQIGGFSQRHPLPALR